MYLSNSKLLRWNHPSQPQNATSFQKRKCVIVCVFVRVSGSDCPQGSDTWVTTGTVFTCCVSKAQKGIHSNTVTSLTGN